MLREFAHTRGEEVAGKVRVPLVVVGPGVAVGRVSSPVQTIDLLPTILSALDIPPPTDRELTQFLAVQKELAADPDRATELCSLQLEGESDENAPKDPDAAILGRKFDANPILGPLLRRQSISGQRFAQVSAQVVGAFLALGMADSLDQTAKEKGKPADNRAQVLAKSAEARAVAARQEEISTVLAQTAHLCDGEGESDDDADDGGSDGSGNR